MAPSRASLGPSRNHPEAFLEPSWRRLGPSWAVLGLPWTILGLSWACLGLSWACLGPVLGHLWPVLRHLGVILSPLGQDPEMTPKRISSARWAQWILGTIGINFGVHFGTTFGSLLKSVSGPRSALDVPRRPPESHQELHSSEDVPFQKKLFKTHCFSMFLGSRGLPRVT